MDHKLSITQTEPIRQLFSLTNVDLKKLMPPIRSNLQIAVPFSPPKTFLSPDGRRFTSERNAVGGETKGVGDVKMGVLFTIEENYYSRKNQNLVSPRPPKHKPTTARPSLYNEPDPSDRVRERKVIFTEGLVKDEPSTSSHRQSLNAKPIIRNIVNPANQNQDNLSCSSRSISVQNSFISQFRSLPKRERPRVDSNKQRFTQIIAHFERKKEMREQGNRNKFNRQVREKTPEKEEQYIDSIFPPVYTSIFINPNKVSRSLGAEIKWKRLSEMFENGVVLNKQGVSQARIVLRQKSNVSEFVATSLNAIKHCNCILQNIFEEQTFNHYGLYLVRIFQQHSWKSIILDQYVPFLNGEMGALCPAFIDVEMEEGNVLQIWPFLLEKAFSYYYSAYELLTFGNTIDFMNEIMGLTPFQLPLKKRSQKEYMNLQSSLQSVDSVAIGEYGHTDQTKQMIIRVKYSNDSVQLVYSESPSYRQHPFTQEIFTKVSRVFLYSPKIYHSLSTNTIGKYSLSHGNHDRSEYSIRKLMLSQRSDCLISVQQKQSRFFVKSSLNYQYMWIRVLLVQRQFDGYRWIQGKYSNSKGITLGQSLSQGEYYLIIMPEWKQTQNFQLTLLVWGNHHVSIQRERGSCEEIIEQACMDLAQRKGKMNQLTPTLCSYNYLCPKTGMIIENINNQKLKQDVKVSRDISGIPCNVRLLPINKDFWPQKGNMISQINVVIPKLSHYTIVLKMRGGVDKKLIQMFASEKEGKEININ